MSSSAADRQQRGKITIFLPPLLQRQDANMIDLTSVMSPRQHTAPAMYLAGANNVATSADIVRQWDAYVFHAPQFRRGYLGLTSRQVTMDTGLDEDCLICFDPLKEGDSFPDLPCRHHTMHTRCLAQWVQGRRQTCPVCRGPVNMNEAVSPWAFHEGIEG